MRVMHAYHRTLAASLRVLLLFCTAAFSLGQANERSHYALSNSTAASPQDSLSLYHSW
jgi:hypothetical protein